MPVRCSAYWVFSRPKSAIDLAAKHPNSTLGVVLINGVVGPQWDRRVHSIRRFSLLNGLTLIAELRSEYGQCVKDAAANPLTAHLAPLIERRYRQLFHRLDVVPVLSAGAALMGASSSMEQAKLVAKNGTPLVILWGNRDKVVVREDAMAVAALTGHEPEVVDGDHFWPITRPELFPELTEQWLSQDHWIRAHLDEIVTRASLDPGTASAQDVNRAFVDQRAFLAAVAMN